MALCYSCVSLQLFFLASYNLNSSIDRHSARKQQILHVRCFCLVRLPSVFELSPFGLIKYLFFFLKVKMIACSLGVKRVIFQYDKIVNDAVVRVDTVLTLPDDRVTMISYLFLQQYFNISHSR